MTKYPVALLILLLLVIECILESQQLVIKSINVPATVKAGELDHVILDCDYDLENTSKQGLVVKWFFKGDDVVYQWIQGKDPLGGESVAKYVDLAYKASNDPYTEYRAMKLDKPGNDLTGEYTCVISTFEDEKTANASMVVYSTEEKFNFEYTRKIIGDKDGLEATCKAEGLYPQPTIEIKDISKISKRQTSTPNYKAVTLREDGLYDVLLRLELLDEQLQEATTTLECTLNIPRVNYSTSRKIIYYSGTTTTTSATTIPQHKMDIQVPIDSYNLGNGGGNFVDRTSIHLLLLPAHLLIFLLFR